MNTKEEILVWRGTPSQWTNLGLYLFCLLLAAGVGAAYVYERRPLMLWGLVVPGALAWARWLVTRCHVYEVTTERIRVSTGVLSRKMTEMELYRVRDYSVVRPFWLRLVGRGHLVLQTSDRTNPQVALKAVPRVMWLKDEVRANTERIRIARGVRDIEVDTV